MKYRIPKRPTPKKYVKTERLVWPSNSLGTAVVGVCVACKKGPQYVNVEGGCLGCAAMRPLQ